MRLPDKEIIHKILVIIIMMMMMDSNSIQNTMTHIIFNKNKKNYENKE